MRAERGYVMFLAALVVAVLALVLLTAARVGADALPTLRGAREDARQQVAAESAFARVAFMMLTEPIGPRSVVVGGDRERDAETSRGREVRLDGRFYRLGEGVFVSVQDESGLVNLNSPDEALLAGLLTQFEVQGSRAVSLAAALADYVDEDELVRLSGAEAPVYTRFGLPVPTNQALETRWQALEALGWRGELNADQRMRLWATTTTAEPQENLNLNSAPAAVLYALVRNRRAAAALLARREQGDLRDLQEIEALTGGQARASGVNFATQAGTKFRVAVVIEGRVARQFFERRLSFGDEDSERPIWQRDERSGRGSAGLGQSGESGSLPIGVASYAP